MTRTVTVRKTPPARAEQAIFWLKKLSEHGAYTGLFMHGDVVDSERAAAISSSTVAHTLDFTVVATDAASWTKANLLKAALNAHLADGTYAHASADVTSGPVATADATDTATGSALLVALKAAINTHVLRSTEHRGLPAVAEQAVLTAVDAATNITSCNELLAIYKRHVYSALPIFTEQGV